MTLQAKLQLGKILFVKCFTKFSKAKLSLANCLSRETNGTPCSQHTQQETVRVLLRGNTLHLVACLSIGPSEANLNFMNSLQTTELGLIAYKLILGAVTFFFFRGSNSYQKTRSYLDKWLLCERCVYHLQKWKQAFFVISLKKFFFLFCTSIALISFNLHYSMSHKPSLI